MTNEFLHFDRISRERWQQLHRKTTPPLTEEELNSIKSFNDEISLQDVMDIYLPLTNLIQIYKRAKEDLAFSKGIFLQKNLKKHHSRGLPRSGRRYLHFCKNRAGFQGV